MQSSDFDVIGLLSKLWFEVLRRRNVKALTSSTSKRFSPWHLGVVPRDGKFQVVNDFHEVVCICSERQEAVEIIEMHNSQDPIRNRDDWLFYRDKG
jgi:hypothetical protein